MKIDSIYPINATLTPRKDERDVLVWLFLCNRLRIQWIISARKPYRNLNKLRHEDSVNQMTPDHTFYHMGHGMRDSEHRNIGT